MATKGDNHYYGLLTTTALRKKVRNCPFNMVFMGKICDPAGASEAIMNCVEADPTKDYSKHEAAIKIYHQELASKKPKLDRVFDSVGSDLMEWKADHLEEWVLLEEVAKGHDKGMKVKLGKRKAEEEESVQEIQKTIAGLLDSLVEAAKVCDEEKIKKTKRAIMSLV